MHLYNMIYNNTNRQGTSNLQISRQRISEFLSGYHFTVFYNNDFLILPLKQTRLGRRWSIKEMGGRKGISQESLTGEITKEIFSKMVKSG